MTSEDTGERRSRPALGAPDGERAAENTSGSKRASWWFTTKNAIQGFSEDECTDQAAALTYYSVLALFPALVALVSLLGIFGQGQSTVQSMLDMVSGFAPGEAMQLVRPVIEQIVTAEAAGLGLVIGLVGALWSASGYVGAFGRTMNRILGIEEGRPMWKLRPMQLALTAGILLLVSLVMIALVVSGPVARIVGDAVGLGDTAVRVWEIAKLPVAVLIVMVVIALLYHVTPNVRRPRMRLLSAGAAVALFSWVLTSAAFGFYVANFGSYNKTYGALAGVIVFLLWLWLTNLSLLFGAEVDAEMERTRQLQSGIEAERDLQLPPKDTEACEKKAAKHEESVEEGRQLRLQAERSGATGSEQDSVEGDKRRGAHLN